MMSGFAPVLRRSFRLVVVASSALVALGTTTLFAQLPAARLSTVFPAGGKPGTTLEATITGTDLELADKLVFTHPGIAATAKKRDAAPFEQGPQIVSNQFTIKIDAAVPPGLYEARAIGKFGISNPRAFVVDDLSEVLEKEPNNLGNQATETPIGSVVNGQINGGADIDFFKIAAKKGQRVIIDCWASRIDSRLDGTLSLYDANGRELASDRDTNYRDPLIDFTAPADGDYFVRLQDSVYGGSGEHFYRLSISAKPYIDYVLPNAGLPGTTGTFTLFGRNLPGGTDAGMAIDGKPLQKLTVQIAIPAGAEAERLNVGTWLPPQTSSVDGFEYRLRGPGGASNPAFIGFASAPVVLEQEPNGADKPQKVNVPCEFVGQSQSARDQDFLTFDAKAGDVYWMELISQRQGVPLDPYFLVQRVMPPDKEGKVVFQDIVATDDSMANIGGTSFNTQCDDPSFRFAAPADGTYRVLIRDLYNRGNPRYVYRLAIRKEQPDFRLTAVPVFPNAPQLGSNPWTTLLRRGSNEEMQILAFRRDGFAGEIEVSVEGMPPGVTCRPVTFGQYQLANTIVFTAADNAADWSGPVRIVGKAKINGKDVVREARAGTVLWPAPQNQTAQARLARQTVLAVTSKETADLQVNVGDGKMLEMSRAGKLEVPVKAVRRGGFAGNVNLNAVNLAQNIQIPNVALNGNATDAKLAVNLPVNVPPGIYTFHLLGQTQFNYKRNEDLAKAAEEEKKRADKLVADLTVEAKKAADAAAKVNADAKAAADAKASAQKASADADAKLKAAQTFQQQTTQRATELKTAANPKQTNVFVPSTTFTIKVTDAPITFPANPPAAQLKQGGKLEVPVTVNRLYAYNDPIQVELVLPGGLAGVKAGAVPIAAGQTAGKLVIEAAANATPGNHSLTIRATAQLNGQALPINQTLPLTIQQVEQPKKK
jgi:hypothetical protein